MKPFISIIILFCSLGIPAQNSVLSQKVSLDFQRARLEVVLNDISLRYRINFSYSTDLINVRQRVSISVQNVALSEALIVLFEKTQIDYSLVGSHIVLKFNPDKRVGMHSGGKQGKEKSMDVEVAQVLESRPESNTELITESPPLNSSPAIQLEMPKTREVRSSEKMYPFDEVLLQFDWLRQATERSIGDNKRLAQVTLLPGFSTNRINSHEITNKISLNILWGYNGGVEGVELGGLFNTIGQNMAGFQLAGLGNTVKGDTRGTQLAGGYNKTEGYARGLQLAGLSNEAGYFQGVQISTLINRTKYGSSGVQVAGFYNEAGNKSNALQFTAGINKSTGITRLQVAGLMNFAGDVQNGQVSTLLNVAKEVKGFQLALINKADTVKGLSIGLLNLVKRGYNKAELFAAEGLHANIQLKLGASSFYNIFQVGARYPEGNNKSMWGFGYGFGSKAALNRRNTLNYEILAIHINENEGFTKKLNSIGQIRLLWNYQVGNSVGLFFGPTANLMISSLKDNETGEIGSDIVPYSLFNADLDVNTKLRGWIGVNTGFRF